MRFLLYFILIFRLFTLLIRIGVLLLPFAAGFIAGVFLYNHGMRTLTPVYSPHCLVVSIMFGGAIAKGLLPFALAVFGFIK